MPTRYGMVFTVNSPIKQVIEKCAALGIKPANQILVVRVGSQSMQFYRGSELVRAFVASLGPRDRERMAEAGVATWWAAAIPPEIARHTVGAAMRDGELVVQVDSPVWAAELSAMSEQLRVLIEEASGRGTVRSVRFTVSRRVAMAKQHERDGEEYDELYEPEDVEPVPLTPQERSQVEHAADLVGRQVVLFADADVSCPAPYAFTRLVAQRDTSYSTHEMSPAAVLEVYRELYGEPPPAYLLAIRGESFELGEPLSTEASANLDAALNLVQSLCATPTQSEWEQASAAGGVLS